MELLPFFLQVVWASLLLGVDGQGDPKNGHGDESPCIPPTLAVPQSAVEAGTHPSQLVIAHRGASAHLPEHTLASYRLGLELGADYIQTDIVPTKDGKLIAVHSLDLNITTDVAQKFPDREAFSEYLNKTGYWTYNFDLDEIRTLTVQQRLPHGRSISFDGAFGIPTLTEILRLLREWNTEILPLRINVTDSTKQAPKPGIVAELKSHPWLLKDANMDLIDLVFQHMKDEEELWRNTLFDRLCYTKRLKIHEYRLPPLVFQAFEGSVLEMFANKWKSTFQSNETVGSMPVPPTMLLVGSDKCLEESFWFQIGDSWRDFVAAIGPDKECLYPSTRGREFMEKAREFSLFVSPWTERPELEYVLGGSSEPTKASPAFRSVVEEIHYFYCTINVHGMFSESVDKAVMAAHMGCNDASNGKHKSQDSSATTGSGQSMCYETDREANLYVGLASFTMGAFVATLASLFMGRRQRRRGGRRHMVPTSDVDADGIDNDCDNGDNGDDDDIEML